MASERKEPVGRRELFSFVHNGQFYVGHGAAELKAARDQGYREDQLLPLQQFDLTSAQWSGVSPVCVDHEPEERDYWRQIEYHICVCCAVLADCAYTFGGFWKYGYAVHKLNLETMVWRRLEPQNREDGPIHKYRAGMVSCGDETLCVFGGYGRDTGQHVHQPGATYHSDNDWPGKSWNNELHVFDIKKGIWSSPETTGPRPPPCAGFSFTRVDLSRAVLFGGRQRHRRVNEVHILDVKSWHWSGAILPTSPASLWPQERSLHSACALLDPKFYSTTADSITSTPHLQSCNVPTDSNSDQPRPKLFVLWGTGNSNVKLAPEAWILDVNNTTWNQVRLPPVVGEPRLCFALGCHNRSPTEAELVVFGGMYGSLSMGGFYLDDEIQGGTTLLYLGLRSLYHLCVDYIAERNEFNDSLLQKMLPPHILNDIIQERDKKANIVRYEYRVARL